MFKYILRRLLIMIPVLIGLTIVVFLLVNVLPGDTARIIAGDYADEATVQSIREAYGLDKPIHIQYINYIKDLLHGDFGRSYHSRRDIATEIANVYPKTIQLALATEVVGVVVGVLPTTGLPLPFFSAGGTSISLLMAATGIILSVSRTSRK